MLMYSTLGSTLERRVLIAKVREFASIGAPRDAVELKIRLNNLTFSVQCEEVEPFNLLCPRSDAIE